MYGIKSIVSTLFLVLLLSRNVIVASSISASANDGMYITTLNNGKSLPLVGAGLGSAEPHVVSTLVSKAMQQEKSMLMFDTQHNKNELFVSSGIVNGIINTEDSDELVTVHIVTRVWYTHLGYERTVLSVRNTFRDLKAALHNERVDVKVHVLLHWPRCYDKLDFMDCEGEEETLSDEIKSAGAPPHLDKENAWKESWKALEDMYTSQEYSIESIGVSNFQLKDMKQLELFATIQPQILQMNVWSLLYNAKLIDYCELHNIHIQVDDLLVLSSAEMESTPNADKSLQLVANDLSKDLLLNLTIIQVVLAWLIQHGISVIPNTTQFIHLDDYLPSLLISVPQMSNFQVEAVANAVEAWASGEDVEGSPKMMVTFEARSKDLVLYYKRPDGSEVKVAYIERGGTFNETTHVDENYRVYDGANKESFIDYHVERTSSLHETAQF